ncbi:MAG: GGDEF domain-containing protein, partial [Planctomycetales bacterium]|nr:GGDEF domain-containing protein [Planctomycetales bacterium]
MEERVQSLHEKATRDPLTRVSNRAEFDRVLALTVQNHLEGGRPCSLIICDIDRFKSINDTFGHQAGDEALVSFAAILAKSCRQGDLVARYGGEEFVMVCGDCDAKGAVELAEKVRAELSQTPLSELKGRCITASFGVAELQNSDNPEAILRRADHALLHAKESGRNRVIYQDGRGGKSPQRQTASTSFNW